MEAELSYWTLVSYRNTTRNHNRDEIELDLLEIRG
jgi:hypothetical protein